MYRIETLLTSLGETNDYNKALEIAEMAKATNHFCYIEIKEVVTTNPYYAKSIKIFR